jgi:hypothetical protein
LRPVTLVEAAYKTLQTAVEKLGEFLCEIAALVLVFIPLDLWKDSLNWVKSIEVLGASAILLLSGIGCHLTATLVKRGRDLYEEAQSNESRVHT